CCTCWLAISTKFFRCRINARTTQTSSAGRKSGRSSPTECRYWIHWHSCKSVGHEHFSCAVHPLDTASISAVREFQIAEYNRLLSFTLPPCSHSSLQITQPAD